MLNEETVLDSITVFLENTEINPVEIASAAASLSEYALTQLEAAEYINVTRHTMREWRKAQRGPKFFVFIKRAMYSQVELDRFMKSDEWKSAIEKRRAAADTGVYCGSDGLRAIVTSHCMEAHPFIVLDDSCGWHGRFASLYCAAQTALSEHGYNRQAPTRYVMDQRTGKEWRNHAELACIELSSIVPLIFVYSKSGIRVGQQQGVDKVAEAVYGR